MSAPSLSLWRIDATLETLLTMREEAEREGDSEQIAALDKALDEYHEQRPAKIDSIAGLILRSQSNQEVLKAEIERLKDRLAAEKALEERVKASTLAAMQRFDVKELKTATTRILRCGNGGLQPLEIADWPKDSSGRYRPMDVTSDVPTVPLKIVWLPDVDKIRAALKQGEQIHGATLLERGEHVRIK